MKTEWVGILVVVICSIGITGCSMIRNRNKISQVSYSSDAGPILPELQWYEEIIITKDNVTLIRNGGMPDSEINAGTWVFAVEKQDVGTLFAQLEAIDSSTIKRIEPDDPIDGGHTESYTIVYGGNKTVSLMYDPGTTYADGELIVEPIDLFIQNLSFPVEAASRYK